MAKPIKFQMPDTNEEPPLFLGEMWAASRTEDKFLSPEVGEGTPLYLVYVFPYVPSLDQKTSAKEAGEELPLFVSYIFPYEEPKDIVLGGGGGAHAALGGKGQQVMFLGKVFSFIAASPSPSP
jgi:hypothetical protein